MYKTNRLIMAIVITIALISIRIAITKMESYDILLMKWINIIALLLIVIQITNETYKNMENNHSMIGKDKNNHRKENKHMKRFKIGSSFFLIFLVCILIVIGYFFEGALLNDILTIIALILSIDASNISEILHKKFYSYF